MMVTLIRRDPQRNRWYSVTVQATLLDGIAVVCRWGSRQTRFQQTRIIPMPSQAAAEALAAQIVMRKVWRGYGLPVLSGALKVDPPTGEGGHQGAGQ